MLLNKFAALLSCSHLRKRQRQRSTGNLQQATGNGQQRATCNLQRTAANMQNWTALRANKAKSATTATTATATSTRRCRPGMATINRRWLPRRQSAINLNDCQPMQQPTMDAQRDANSCNMLPTARVAVSTFPSSPSPLSAHKTHLPPPDKTLKYVKNLILILRRHRICHKYRNFSYNTLKFVAVCCGTNCMRIVSNEILIKLYYHCLFTCYTLYYNIYSKFMAWVERNLLTLRVFVYEYYE